MLAQHRIRNDGPSRSGFTLIELLVVIAIIGVLVALVGSAAFRIVGAQQQGNTELLVRKVSDALDQQVQAVLDQANNNDVIPAIVATWASDAGGIPNPRRAKAIWRKLRLKQEFPMTANEARDPSTSVNETGDPSPSVVNNTTTIRDAATNAAFITPRPSYVTFLGAGLVPTAPTVDERGAMLFMILQNNRRGMNFDTSSLSSSEKLNVTVPVLAGTPVATQSIIDGWGIPIVHFRWPTGNPDINNPISTAPVGPTSSPLNDLQDPEGTLADPTWCAATTTSILVNGAAPAPPWTNQQIFRALCHPLPNYPNPNFPTAPSITTQSFFVRTVVASFGPNRLTSLDANMNSGAANLDNDNIYSYRLRLGSRGD